MTDTLNTLKVITRGNKLELSQVIRVFNLIPDLKYKLILHQENRLSSNSSAKYDPRNADLALLQGKADLIFQSVTNLPYPLPEGLVVIALLEADLQLDTVLSTNTKEQIVIVAPANREELKALFASSDLRNQYGKITLVGFGPGNPDLLTLGGDKALSQSDIIFHDDLLDKNYLNKYTAEKVYVGKRKGSHCFEQNEINRLILAAAKAGKQVVRLKGGDPMIFAHGGEEVEYLERNLVDVEVIPGVSSGIAVASLLKIPLTHRGISSSMAFISGHSEKVHLPDADTLVIYMGGSNIQTIARKAITLGRNSETPVMLVYNLSLPDQQEFFFTLKELSLTEQKFQTPVIIVIGEVINFRNKSFTKLTENDLSVNSKKSYHFHELGNELEKLKSFEWLIFTNRHTVADFFNAFEKRGKDSRFLAAIKIAAIGKNTIIALREHGIRADLIFEDEKSEGFVARIKALGIAPSKALMPRSVQALSVLQQSLIEIGWEVNQLILNQHLLRKTLSPLAFHLSEKSDIYHHKGIEQSMVIQ
jgi:uroporphyrinogen III methyltransferase/synthase